MKIYMVVFVGVLIILFAVVSFFAIGAQNQDWGSVVIGGAVGCMVAIGLRAMKKKGLPEKKS
jgi:NO-binding membrane sensor protein with MHYT domain